MAKALIYSNDVVGTTIAGERDNAKNSASQLFGEYRSGRCQKKEGSSSHLR